jgi:SAM-dependent methyltransferase
LCLHEGSTALDLGSGTGKFLPCLLATGAHVIAVEPVAAMRERIAQSAVWVLAGAAERIPLQDSSVDAVTCAQSFHWSANRRALEEIRRVLKPGGALGLVWNVHNESVGWVAALTGIIAPYEGSTPRYASGDWRKLFPANGFTALEEANFPNPHYGPPENVIVDRILSVSFIAALTASEQEKVASQVRALIEATPELAGRSEVTFPYRTFAYHCRKIDQGDPR